MSSSRSIASGARTRPALAIVAAAAFVVIAAPAVASDPLIHSVGDDWAPVADDGGAYLGVRLTEETEHPEGGARVTHVVEGSPAEAAGLLEGDVVVAFDGEVVRGPGALTMRLHSREPGEQVSLTVRRDGGQQTLDVELGRRTGFSALAPDVSWSADRWKDWQEDFQQRMDDLGKRLGRSYTFTVPDGDAELRMPLLLDWGRPKLGVQLVETTPELREHLGGSESEGVLVSKVLEDTPAESAGIMVGDLILSVDGESVASVDALREALASRVGETFPVRVMREGRERSLEVSIPGAERERPTGPRARLGTAPLAPGP